MPSQARCTRQRGPREADGRYTRSTRQVYGGLPACYLPCRATACRTRVRPVLLFRASTPLEDLGLPAPLPAGLYGRRAAPSKPVRGCPCGGPVGSQRPRTYSGQRRPRKTDRVAFVQVNGYVWWRGEAVCKTVGSAYVGSNPTPATRFRMLRAGDAGLRHRLLRAKGAVTRTVGCVPWAMRGPDPAIARPLRISPQMPSELRKY